MADEKKVYAFVIGFVQFDPVTRDVNGKTIREITVRTPTKDGQKLVRVTIWPEFEGVQVEKGYLVAAEGAFRSGTYQSKATGEVKESLDVSANNFVAFPTMKPASRPVESVGGSTPAPF